MIPNERILNYLIVKKEENIIVYFCSTVSSQTTFSVPPDVDLFAQLDGKRYSSLLFNFEPNVQTL